jgi:CheY-like chemotaxis protein
MHERKAVPANMRLLYIEPDHANALLLQQLLAFKTNYTLHRATDGNSGLRICQELNPDLVLTEMHLPDMTAYDVLQELRSEGATKTLPCVVLSGDAMPGNVKQALDTGFDDYWTKPIDVWLLLQRLEGILNRASHSRHRHGRVTNTTAGYRQGSHHGTSSTTALLEVELSA